MSLAGIAAPLQLVVVGILLVGSIAVQTMVTLTTVRIKSVAPSEGKKSDE